MSNYKSKKPVGLIPPPRVRMLVRCLGPILPEHSFYSVDKCCNRICSRCAPLVARDERYMLSMAVVRLSDRVSIYD